MDDDALAHLEREVAELRDRVAIADLLHRYCRFADRNDPDGLAGCFTPDCVADYGPGVDVPSRGAAARREMASRDLALFAATSHHLSNIQIEFQGPDLARTESSVVAWHRPIDGGSDWHLWAQYHDVVVRTAGGWRIAERRMFVAGTEGFPPTWAWHMLPRRPGADG